MAVSFAVSSDVVVPVHYTDVLRGEATSALLQVALEHLLHFQHRGYVGPSHFDSFPQILNLLWIPDCISAAI